MKKIIYIYSFILIALVSCSTVEEEVLPGGIKIESDYSDNINGKFKCYVKKQKKSVEISSISNGFTIDVKKKATVFGKRKLTCFFYDKADSVKFADFITYNKACKEAGLIGVFAKFETIHFNNKSFNVFIQEGIDKRLVESNENREGALFDINDGLHLYESMNGISKVLMTEFITNRLNNIQSNNNLLYEFVDYKKAQQTRELMKSKRLNSVNGFSFLYYINPLNNKVQPILTYQPVSKSDWLKALILEGNDKEVLASLVDTAFLKYFDIKDSIVAPKDSVLVLSEVITIPSGYFVKLKEGFQLQLDSNAGLISFSPVSFIGSNEKPILISSSNENNFGIHVIGAGGRSIVKHVDFNGLSNIEEDFYKLPSAVTFYESPVNIMNCKFLNNTCEDALNIFRSSPFLLDSCYFENTFSDGFDADFSDGTLRNTVFNKIGNDGVDVSGSKITVNNCSFKVVYDKGLSAGEDSDMEVNNVTLSKTSLAITAKDKSVIVIKNSAVDSSDVVYCVFQKKSEFGPSKIIADSISFDEVKMPMLIEEKSQLIIDGDLEKGTRKDVKEVLYGKKFGKATVK